MSLKESIRQTIAYSSFFGYPQSLEEIHHWLISSQPVSINNLQSNFNIKLTPQEKILRKKLKKNTQKKYQQVRRLIKVIDKLPFIKMVAVTGSVSIGNTHTDDDIDLFIITKANTLWLFRPLILLTTSLFFPVRRPHQKKVRDHFCFNLWLDTCSLQVPKSKHDLYVAHEVMQIDPVINKDHTYEQFLSANSWVKKYLANAYLKSLSKTRIKKHSEEKTIGDELLKLINLISYKIQYLYMKPKITTELVNLHSAYFHPNNLSASINKSILE